VALLFHHDRYVPKNITRPSKKGLGQPEHPSHLLKPRLERQSYSDERPEIMAFPKVLQADCPTVQKPSHRPLLPLKLETRQTFSDSVTKFTTDKTLVVKIVFLED
jgi:hypothetical protein